MTASRYRLERLLARGRHAGVWLACDLQRREQVALKVARHGSLRREFDTLRALAGEHVVRARDSGMLPDGQDFFATDHVRAGALASATLPQDEVARALRGAALALAHVHRKGWVHRDIKPAHLLVQEGGNVMLCDFGSACRAGTRETNGEPSAIGTPRYAAPEQVEGAAATPAADVYSLGVCAFEWLAGRPPFQGQTLTELFSQHLRAPVPALPRETAPWQALIDALLAKEPARRPADGHAVLARLEPLTGAVA
jgi:serine/threonine protein kinase